MLEVLRQLEHGLEPPVHGEPNQAGGIPAEIFAPPTGSMSGVDPGARAALLDATAPTITDPEGRYQVVTGPKYDPDRKRSLTEVGFLVGEDLMVAQDSGSLPPSAEFSVRFGPFAGGQVRVEIRNLPDLETLEEDPEYSYQLNRDARELEYVVHRVANAYNKSVEDSLWIRDIARYHAIVSIETEDDRGTRQLLAAEQKVRAAVRRRAAEQLAAGPSGDRGQPVLAMGQPR